jgi:uncharacterized protein (TIGR03437 family)
MMKIRPFNRKLSLSKVVVLCAAAAAANCVFAQGSSLALASGSGAPGGTVALNLNFQPGGAQATGIQWALIFPSADISSVTVAATSTATSAGEILSCSSAAGHVNCLMINLSSNTVVVPSGVIAVATFHISPTTQSTSSQILMTGLSASDGTGSSLPLSGTGGQITINQPAPPTASLSNLSCTPASITTPGTATCTVSLTAAAPSNTTVALSSNNTSAGVPASVVVPSGLSSTTFTANASAVSANTSAMLTASLNGNLRNFSLGLTTSSVAQPGVSSLICSPLSPIGGASVSCTVNLATAAPAAGTTVTLSSNNSYAVPPNQLNIPGGISSGVFITATSAVTAVQSSTISATSAGITRSIVLTIQPPAGTSLSSLICSPAVISPGGTSSCTVTITSSAPANGTIVTLGSSTGSVSIPNSVLIPSGANSAAFNVTAGAAADGNAALTATLSGVSTSFQLTVTSQIQLVSLNCASPAVAPGGSSTCTVSLNKTVQSGTVEVLLTSNKPKVTVPGSAVVLAGNLSATFTATAASNATNDSATLSATLGNATVTTSLTIAQNSNVPTLVCNPSILQTPASTTCTFTLNTAPQTNLLVTMTSTSASLTSPPSITISAGTTSAMFTATAAAVTTSATVTLTAMGQGTSQTLTLNPPPNTNVSVTSISCGPQSLTGGGNSTCNLTLSGAAPAGGAHVQLSSSSTQISVPGSIQVPEGSPSAEFMLSSPLIDHDENVTLTANLGSSSAQTKLSLAGLKLVSLSCTPKSLRSGLPFSCQATLNSSQATASVVLSVASSDSRVTVPASVASQAGQAAFQGNTTVVPLNQSVTVSASYHGVTVQATVTLTPAPPVLTAPGREMVLPGKLLTFTVSAADPANLAIALSASGLPAGAMFNPNGGTFNWAPLASQVGLYTVHFTATNIALVSTTQDVVVEVASDTPVIFSVANAASYVDDGGCSPGAVTTIVGSGFVKTGAKAAEVSPIPTVMNGVRVSINGNYLPVFYAAENQINFQCPQLSPGDPLSLTIESSTGTSTPHSSTMQFATPGIFTIDGSGQGQGAILIANTPNIAMPHTDGIPSAPVSHGDFVSIYATGLGSVSTEVPSGSAAPLLTLDKVKAPVDVIIDGQSADVSFAGLAPGFTGLYQVNARIPSTASAGDAISVKLSVHLPDGTVVTSNIVTIAIAAAN